MGLFGSIRSSRDLAVEGRKARDYDEFSRTYRMKDLEQYARTAARELGGGAAVLDVATGPGYFCTELAKLDSVKVEQGTTADGSKVVKTTTSATATR